MYTIFYASDKCYYRRKKHQEEEPPSTRIFMECLRKLTNRRLTGRLMVSWFPMYFNYWVDGRSINRD